MIVTFMSVNIILCQSNTNNMCLKHTIAYSVPNAAY